jgi:chromosomal replication initiation ATPase DnaA
MLFTPWRNEETDLIGKYSSYEERYLTLQDLIQDQLSIYAVSNEELNNAQEQLNSAYDDDEDQFDLIAPVTQDAEYQDENEGAIDLHPDFNENYDLSQDIGIPSTLSNNEPLILNEIPDNEYRRMIQTLNKEQNEFFYHTLHLIKTSDKPFYSFLSGGAGVGKSHLTKPIYQAALKYYNTRAGDDFSQVRILLLAPTRKAAFIIQGTQYIALSQYLHVSH